MKIEKLNEENKSGWIDLINKNKEARIQNTLLWKSAIEKTYKNCKPIYLISMKNKNIRAIFPFFLIKSKIFSNRIISLPFIEENGFLGEYNKSTISEVINELKKEKVSNIEIRFNSLMKNFKKNEKILLSLGFKVNRTKQEMIVGLSHEKGMWKDFHKHTRNDIRKAEKSDLELREIDNEERLKDFYKLYLKNLRDFGTPQHSYEFFLNIFKIMKENFAGFNCYYKNKIAGSIIFLYLNQHGYVAFNVSDHHLRGKRPNDLLYWNIIKYALRKGVKYINLGEVNKDSTESREIGLYKFKRKWLGNTHDKAYFYYDLEKKENKEEKKDKLKKFRSAWKKIPAPILKKLGPKIASQLGI